MSTRAYKVVVPAELADAPAWNVTRQDEINRYFQLFDFEGQQAVSVAEIRRMLNDPAIELEPEQRAQFEQDIKGEPEDGAIEYMLF